MKRIFVLSLLLCSLLLAGQAQAVSLSLLPSAGTISGTPGQTIGWGFTLTNEVNYLVVSGVELHPSSANWSIYNPTLGSYNDLLASQYFEVGPGHISETQNFDLAMGQGFGSFMINSGAARGSMENLTFWLFYDLYADSPSIGGSLLSSGNYVTADAGVYVDREVSAVPEPSTMILLSCGLLGAGALMRNKRRI